MTGLAVLLQATALKQALAPYCVGGPWGRLLDAEIEALGDVRALPADPIVLRQDWLRAYDFTTDKGGQALNDYARLADPFAQVGKAQVSVDVSSVIRASPASFRVAWTERRYQDGALAETTRWSAILTVAIQRPRTADGLRRNPLGVFVDALNWSKELSQ